MGAAKFCRSTYLAGRPLKQNIYRGSVSKHVQVYLNHDEYFFEEKHTLQTASLSRICPFFWM